MSYSDAFEQYSNFMHGVSIFLIIYVSGIFLIPIIIYIVMKTKAYINDKKEKDWWVSRIGSNHKITSSFDKSEVVFLSILIGLIWFFGGGIILFILDIAGPKKPKESPKDTYTYSDKFYEDAYNYYRENPDKWKEDFGK